MIGFNIMVALKDYEQHVRCAAKAGADLIISGAGLPTELPAFVEGTETGFLGRQDRTDRVYREIRKGHLKILGQKV